MRTRAVGFLTAVTLACWVLAIPLVLLGSGRRGLAISAVACLVCLMPAAASLQFGLWSLKRGPNWQMVAILGGGGLRMLAVLAIGVALAVLNEAIRLERGLFVALLVYFYATTLATETWLLVRLRKQHGR